MGSVGIAWNFSFLRLCVDCTHPRHASIFWVLVCTSGGSSILAPVRADGRMIGFRVHLNSMHAKPETHHFGILPAYKFAPSSSLTVV